MRRPFISGHCAFPETAHPERSHERCQRLGHGNTANPAGEFAPCPCHCHLGTDEFECANCGAALREAPYWPNEDEPGEMVYVHFDTDRKRALGEECEHVRKAREVEEPEDEPVLDDEYEIPLTELPDDEIEDEDDDLWDLLDDEDD